MGSDPNPNVPVIILHRERPMASSDPGGPEFANLLETERWMPRVLLEQFEILARELLDWLW